MNLEPSVFYILVGLALLISTVVLGWLVRKKWQPQTLSWLAMLLCWLVVPVISAWLVSFLIPVLQPKRVLLTLPGFYLLVAYVTSLPTKNQWRWAVVAVLLSVNIISTLQYYRQPVLQRENWRAVYGWIHDRYAPADTTLLFAFDEPFAPWRWYDEEQRYKTVSLGKLSVNEVTDLRSVIEPATETRFIITFDYLTDLSDPEHLLHQELSAYGFTQVDMVAYPNIGFVRVWAQPNSVIGSRL